MRIGVVSLGCAKNQVDTEYMLGLLHDSGYEFVSNPKRADILVVNTCGFIDSAKQESINTILEMAQYKSNGSCRLLIVTGCLAERYRKELSSELPEIDILLGVREYDRLPKLIADWFGLPCQQVLSHRRLLVSPPYRAYLRIADGCNNRCSYCAIPLIRGNLRSEPKEQIITEAKRLADEGVTELTVIAQDTSGYGRDLYGTPSLISLLKELDRIDGFNWIRLLYTYPDTVTTDLLDTLAQGSRTVPYLDIPLQHCNDAVLKRMNRRGTRKDIEKLLDHLYKNYPDFTLRTTMMVGFPGETDEQFEELLEFLRSYPFDRVGAFTYSPEENTPASMMPEQVDEQVKQERYHRLMQQQQVISRDRNTRWIGRELTMLVEQTDPDTALGRTAREAPDADGFVAVPGVIGLVPGQYVSVRITGADSYDMTGEII